MRALLILGPTASGKSALALALAERLGGEIVNADSMQVYADLRVLTARPSPEEEARVPHHIYGVVDAATRFSAGAWLRTATPVLADIAARGKTAIVVGGTGLHFRALTEGLDDIPEPPAALRAALEARAAADGPEVLHAELAARDSDGAARIRPRDTPKIIRALSVLQHTGRPIDSFRTGRQRAEAPTAGRPPLGVALTPPRADLYRAIDARFAAMLSGGALEEARALMARGLDPALPAMKAHGMPWLMAHLRGEMTLAEAAALAARDTRRYAKRQFTWIANQTPDWPRIASTGLEDRIAHVCTLLKALDGQAGAN
jgi:tRNA dimethylallyltransferase